MRKRRKSEELDAALRAEPEYKELCELLSKQSPEKRSRSDTYLARICEGSQEGKEIMESTDKTALQRAFELRAEGKSFAKIADTLNQEKFRNAAGNRFDRSGLRKLMLRNKGKISQASQPVAKTEPEASSQPSQDLAREKQAEERSQYSQSFATQLKGPDRSQPSPICESESIEETAKTTEPYPCETGEPSHAPIPCEWLAPLRNLIREEIQTAMREYANAAQDARLAISAKNAIQDLERPPARPRKKGSREYAGEKMNLGGARVDQVLFDIFKAKRQEFAGDASALMEAILWNAFGKPKLSFEQPADADPTEQE